MLATFDDPALVQHHDVVGILDRRQPVGDHKGRTAFHQAVHARLDQTFRTRIDGGGRLIQDQPSAIVGFASL